MASDLGLQGNTRFTATDGVHAPTLGAGNGLAGLAQRMGAVWVQMREGRRQKRMAALVKADMKRMKWSAPHLLADMGPRP